MQSLSKPNKEGGNTMVDYEAVGRRLKAKRREKKMSQEELAKAVQISLSFYGNIERGKRIPSIDTLVALANVLGVGADYLLADNLTAIKPIPISRTDSLRIRSYLREIIDHLDYGDAVQETLEIVDEE